MGSITATEGIAELENQLIEIKEQIAKLRREAPREKVEDYVFKALNGSDVRLSELFQNKEDLIVVHNMGRGCVYCTLWADGLIGVTDHILDRTALVLVTPDTPEVAREFAQSRGWKFPIVCDVDKRFTVAMGMYNDNDGYWPGTTGLHKTVDGIERVATAFFGPGDDFCATWRFFDLLADGAGDWSPKYKYS